MPKAQRAAILRSKPFDRGAMGKPQRTRATLCIDGDSLVPEEITRLLGCMPTQAHVKGDKVVNLKTGHRRVAPFGQWRLEASVREPGDLDAQIIEICSAVSADAEVWQSLTTHYKVRLFCGLFMGQFNDGDSISSASLLALGARGIKLDLDIYGMFEPEETASEA